MERRRAPSVAGALRAALSDPKDKQRVMEIIGWDNTQASRYLSGQMGIVEDKLDAAIAAVGFVAVTPKYINWLAEGCEIGAHCQCARDGLGVCGPDSGKMKRAA